MVSRDPKAGTGKPEPLKYCGGNVWSRRINEADRLVYEIFDDRIEFRKSAVAKSGNFSYRYSRSVSMKTSRFTESQVIAVLNRAEAGTPVPELCRTNGISSATFYSGGGSSGAWTPRWRHA